ncbi:hypothetical protein [Actinocrispum wychmicini]|uniref:Anti-sigma factor n=1 Tax=Actinocrispum wychmicini TaxID=1213861 RepID=A0A4R2K4E7_9PSEU|nr:hypothetical protein [Actinocrispum wychmicini]TCO64679.1 hypothetical protein EV192_101461 [Actinocrispum wychmicini]
MTGIERGSGGPPWSVDLLADLQAGALDPQAAAELWPRVNADPAAMEIIAALEATQADLREFAFAPAPPMPARFAARLDEAIATESRARSQSVHVPPPAPGHAPVINLADARKRRNRRLGWGAGFLAAAAAAVGIAFAAVPSGTSTPGVAQQTSSNDNGAAPGPLAFTSDQLGKEQLNAARGHNDYGTFSDKDKLTACLAANGISTKVQPLGARQVTVDGKSGTLLVLSHSATQFRLVVVGPDCGPGTPAKLADKTVS